MFRVTTLLMFPVLFLALAACEEKKTVEPQQTNEDHGGSGHSHAHSAPNGGLLVPLGDHAANVELKWDKAAGTLDAFVFDGCAESPIRVPQGSLSVTLTAADGTSVTHTLASVADVLTGEKVGDSSRFSLTDGELSKAETLKGTVGPLTIRGHAFEPTPFTLSGNVHDHDHDH